MKKDLLGHRAVVTGASSGIGEQYARQLAARGADLVVAARRGDRLQALAAELKAKHAVEVQVVEVDLGRPDAAKQLFEAATAQGAHVTMLINNAGIGPYGAFVETDVAQHGATVALNVAALTELCHRFAKHMLQHGKSSYLANISSIASFQGTSKFAVYSGTKVYVRVFSEILARELAQSRISVTCVCPGGTLTEFLDSNGQTLNEGGQGMMMTSEAVVRIAIDGMLRGRTLVVPGILNKLACLFPRFVPRGLALSLADMTMRRTVTETQKLTQQPRS